MIRIGYLVTDPRRMSPEEKGAWNWLTSAKSFRSAQIQFGRLKADPSVLDGIDVLWWHFDQSVQLPPEATSSDVQEAIIGFARRGKSFLGSLLAAQYVHSLGLESSPANVIRKDAWDQECWIKDYPDIRGFGSNQGHPIFDGLAGAVFTWNPGKGVPFSGAFYSNPGQPDRGRVVAVERQYIRLNEDWRMISEYAVGKGRVVTIGSMFFFSFPRDRFRPHLEKFAGNCLTYLGSPGGNGTERTYWQFGPRTVREVAHTSRPVLTGPQELEVERSGLVIHREPEQINDSFFDVGGRRILIMGKEQSGIQEVWCHPFRLLHSLRTGFQIESGEFRWFDQLRPKVTIRPESVTRAYSVGELRIEETIAGSVDRPGGLIHYQIDTNHPLQIIVSACIDQRVMWPHSENATGSLQYSWDESLRAFIVSNEPGNLVSIIGASQTADEHLAGRYDSLEWDGSGLKGHATDVVQVGAGMRFAVTGRTATFSVVFAGSDRGEKEAGETYKSFMARPAAILKKQVTYYQKLLGNSTIIQSPDEDFNEGYRWALVAADRFFVETPKLGTSLMAGFGTTERGWDGGQKISGRPGYAWYFGRDACWTAFAMLGYGAHEKVKEVLRFLGTYQDLNGKILHEMTTSGHVHYDAADSTPLYCILMGRYVRASGDVKFAKEQFSHLQKAMDFCFSTDTDKDHLIENTNVGHGWVEGGKLFPVHTEFYLAACWSAALEEASHVATVAGKRSLAESWKDESDRVRKKIKREFWNEKTKFYNFGKYADGSYNVEKTVLPAVATILGSTDPAKIGSCLDAWAGAAFSTDWGVRIVGSDNAMFDPEGYHYGSIWPLFTGWVALAEFASQRPLQGFMHTIGTLLIYQHWAGGYVEEVLNGRIFKPSGVCSHQAWSESMVLQPLLEGMLGLQFDAKNKKLTMRPWFPPQWDRVVVRNIKAGATTVNLAMTCESGRTRYTLTSGSPASVGILFQPLLPLGTEVREIIEGKKRKQTKIKITTYENSPAIKLSPGKVKTVELIHSGGVGLIPPALLLKEEQESNGIRIIGESLRDEAYVLEVEGRSGSVHSLGLADPDHLITEAANADLTFRDGVPVIRVTFDRTGQEATQKKTIRLRMKSS